MKSAAFDDAGQHANKRPLLTLLLIALVLLCPWKSVNSADFPSRPIRIVVPSTPGGALDVLVRLLSPRLTTQWGQPIVIDNRAGAAGIVGSEIVAKAAPDGHTLLVVATGYSANPFLYEKLPYDTPRDFAPITVMAWAPNVLVVHPSVAAKTVRELIALAKEKPGQLNYASSGIGTGGHLSMALLARTTGISLVHVPYKGAGAATAAVVGGQSQILFTATGAANPQIKAGRLRALAVTSAKRVPSLPDIPTVAESGVPGYVVDGWYAMLAPGKTPRAVVDRIYRDVATTLKMPEVAAQIETAGFAVGGIPPAEFGRYIDAELRKWGAVIKEAGIKAE
jgi:tripartite-type tricarboxylate transporter receptor subunit TctC